MVADFADLKNQLDQVRRDRSAWESATPEQRAGFVKHVIDSGGHLRQRPGQAPPPGMAVWLLETELETLQQQGAPWAEELDAELVRRSSEPQGGRFAARADGGDDAAR